MSPIYAVRTSSGICLKVMNEHGEELSYAFDDSAGAMPVFGRVSAVRFGGRNLETQLGEEKPIYGFPERFLEILADHLGYEVTKKT